MKLLSFAKNILLRKAKPEVSAGTQFGAIPYRIIDGRVVFLMVTSRRSANWVFPKGSVIPGLSPAQSAAQEALEEAGVRGVIAPEPIGQYMHPHNNPNEGLVNVQLFPLLVTNQDDQWDEEPQRFRHWALLPQVRRLLASKEAAKMAVELNRRILMGDYTPGNSRITE